MPESETPIYDAGIGQAIKRAPFGVTPSTFNDAAAKENLQYLVRFFRAGEGTDLYYMQFANGNFVAIPTSSADNQPVITGTAENATTYSFYNTVAGGTTFGWNLENAEQGQEQGRRIDNKGVNANLVFWGTGRHTSTSGNNVWYIYPVTLNEEVINVTYHLYYNGQEFETAQTAINQETSPAIPESYQRDFCNYSYYTDPELQTPATTIGIDGSTEIDIYVKVETKESFPFEIATELNSAKWYIMNIRASTEPKSVTVGSEPYANVKKTKLEQMEDEASHWAFVGNPHHISIYNKTTGDKTLTKEGNNDVANNVVMREGESPYTWALFKSGDYFLLRDENIENCYIHDYVNELKTWTHNGARTDAGSTFSVEEVDLQYILNYYITEANAIISGIEEGAPGYPKKDIEASSSILTSLKPLVSTETPPADMQTAITELKAAIAQAYSNMSSIVDENRNYTPRTDVYYTITNARGAMVYDPAHDDIYDVTNDKAKYLWYDTDPDDNDPNNLWGFIEKEGHYYMYNVGKKQFAAVGTGTTMGGKDNYGATWIFSNTPAYITLDDGIADEIAAPKVRIQATNAVSGESYTMSVSPNYHGPVITYDKSGDGGVPMLFSESTYEYDESITAEIMDLIESVEPYREALDAACERAGKIPYGTGLGEYGEDHIFNSVFEKALSTIYLGTTKEDFINAREALEAAIANLTLNMPEAGTFLRIKGGVSDKYLAAGNANNNTEQNPNNTYNMSDATDATTIFYYDGETLLNYSSGLYNGMTANSWDWVVGTDAASLVNFGDGKTIIGDAPTATAGYFIKSDNSQYFKDGGNEPKPAARKADNYNTQDASSWILEEVTDLPLTLSNIGGKYYSTLNLPVDVTITGANAYAPTLSENNTIICGEAINEVRAGTPIILISDDNANAVAKIGTVSSTATSVLSGTLGKTPNTGNNVYVLSYNDNNVVAFYKYTGANIPGFKAYFAQEAGATESAKFAISFADDDDITAVESVEAAASSAENAVYYDLQGRRVVAPQAGQLYIINGKKVVY